jgi:sugar O-acyltransferase (sialic acid O-acetyltransferase NeuD family)
VRGQVFLLGLNIICDIVNTVKQNKNLVIFGISNVISDLMDAAQLNGLRIKTIVMNQPEVLRERTRSIHDRIRRIHPTPDIIGLEAFSPADNEVYATGTTSPAKSHLVEKLKRDFGIEFLTMVHPTACVSSMASMEEGVFVGANSAVGAETSVRSHAFINRGVTIGHDSIIGEYARLSPGCNIGGHVRIGRAAMIGMGANVIQELVVGDDAVVAAGAVVINDVSEKTLVAGIPAKLKKQYGA